MSNKGWECPVCGKGVAPGEKTCDHGEQAASPPIIIPEPYPVYPPHDWPHPWAQPQWEMSAGTIYMDADADVFRNNRGGIC